MAQVPHIKFLYKYVAVGMLAAVLFFGSYLLYNSIQNTRRIKSLFSRPFVTSLPPDVEHILEATSTAQIPGGLSRSFQEKKLPIPTSIHIPILMYHYVEYVKDRGDRIRQSLNITPSTFENQVLTLKNDGYTFLAPLDVTAMLEGKRPIPTKPIILSFDDGYRDFYTDVFPILKKYQVKAVSYVISGFLNHANFMTTAQLKEIDQSDLVEIGSHTVNHRWLKQLNAKTAEYEVAQSKLQLEKWLKMPVTSFAYPYGAFDEQSINLVKAAGYTNAVSTIPGVDDSEQTRYFLFRLRPGYRTGKDLLNYLQQSTFKTY